MSTHKKLELPVLTLNPGEASTDRMQDVETLMKFLLAATEHHHASADKSVDM
jgi:hypothetical protein